VLPLHDENPTVRQPIATVLLILLNASMWVLLLGTGSELRLAKSLCEFGLIPGDLFGLMPAGTTIPVTETGLCA
jgi:hypothetical protein